MKKTLVCTSFFIVIFLICTSFSSVVAYQSVQIQQRPIKKYLENTMDQRFDALLQLKNRIDTQNLKPNTGLIDTPHIQSLLSRCSVFYDTAADPTIGRILVVLVLTILTEFVVYLTVIDAPAFVLLLLSVVINSLTNPAVNFIYYTVYNNVLVLELLVVIVESFLISVLFNGAGVGVGFTQAFFLSLIANLMSYIIATGLARFLFDVLPTTNS
ncbi:MAG: hypothetical protein V1726_01460 [Methanobacteriota archaeon]